jgi:hypothetical protein
MSSIIEIGSYNSFADEIVFENLPLPGPEKTRPPIVMGTGNVFKKKVIFRFQQPEPEAEGAPAKAPAEARQKGQ